MLNVSVAPMEIAVQVVVAIATQIINKKFKITFPFHNKGTSLCILLVQARFFFLLLFTLITDIIKIEEY